MSRKVWGALAAAVVATAMASAPALAQSEDGGKHAGSILVRGRLIGVIPENSSSSISLIGGKVNSTSAVMPEVDFSYFVTDNIALELIAATSQHKISASGTSLGNVAVGKTWVLPPALTAQYHFMPKDKVSPYVGAGLNYTLFYGTSAAGGTVTQLAMQNNFGAVLQAGVDFDLGGRWFGNVDVKQIFLNTRAKLNGGAIIAKTALNPTVVGAGIGYRF